MRWTIHGVAFVTAGCLLAANIQPASAQQTEARGSADRQGPRRVHEERDRQTGAVLSALLDDQGTARVTVTVGDFALQKAVESTGDSTIRLTQGNDTVSIVLNQTGYVIKRGDKTARIDIQSARQEDADAVRSLIAGSAAVRTFRRLTASMENRDENDSEGPLFLGTLIDGAVVAKLDGDAGATARIGKRVTRKQRATLHAVRLMPNPLYADCLGGYEMALLQAWDQFAECRDWAWSYQLFIWFFAEDWCEFEWLVRTQQYIYQFISCFAFPF